MFAKVIWRTFNVCNRAVTIAVLLKSAVQYMPLYLRQWKEIEYYVTFELERKLN